MPPTPTTLYLKQNPVLYNLSLPFPHYTPFQNLMRHFLFQRGEYSEHRVSRPFHITHPELPPDTAECTCQMVPRTGDITIHVRRQGEGAGTYIDNPKDIPVTGVRCDIGQDVFVLPSGFQQYDGLHPTVICCIPCSRIAYFGRSITQQAQALVAAGYHVLYYNIRKREQFCLDDTARNELYAIRGVVAVMSLPQKDGKLIVYPSPNAILQTHSFGQRMTLAEWIAEQAAAAAPPIAAPTAAT